MSIKTRKELIKKYVDFFKSKKHKVIPSSGLIPSNDPTVLFTTAGMQPLVPYLLGQKHPLGKRLVNVQKCIRTTDIEEVGDTFHHTFFEMLGNWSLGDYWKEDAIKMTFKFHTEILKIPVEKYAVSIFSGNKKNKIQMDRESMKIWQSLGIQKERIALLDDNWWNSPGKSGPCGPDTEMFYWTGKRKSPKRYDSNNKIWVEIGNNVLMQYTKDKKGNYYEAKQKNIDFGGGLERTLAILNKFDDNYLTSVWQPIIKKIEKISKKTYRGNEKSMRIIADHIKAATMILGGGVLPSNTEHGYVLRRLIRRSIRYGKMLMMQNNFTKKISKVVIEMYSDYPEIKNNKDLILREIDKEESRFRQSLSSGLKYFEKISQGKKSMPGKDAFLLFQSYGFPIEMTLEMSKEKNIKVDTKNFEKELQKHKKLSQTAAKGKFSSGLADNSEKTTRLHTSTHLLNEALRHILKDANIAQRGSNITPERLRFDFSFSRKLTDEELIKVEDLVNAKIQQGLEVTRKEMPFKEALKKGFQGEFGTKYPEVVSTYEVNEFSKEICTGPHVKNTKEIGRFKIIKEESSSAGIRRIKAIIK